MPKPKNNDDESPESEKSSSSPNRSKSDAAEIKRSAAYEAMSEFAKSADKENIELDKEQKRLDIQQSKAKIANSPFLQQGIRKAQAQEKREKDAASKKAAEDQRRSDFWNQGKSTERAEVREAREARAAQSKSEFESRRAQNEERIKPVREAAFARQEQEKAKQKMMQDPENRLANMRTQSALNGGHLKFADVRGPGGKQATYVEDSPEGKAAYQNTRGAAVVQQANSEMNKASGTASGRATPQIPQVPTPAAPVPALAPAQNTQSATAMFDPKFNPNAGTVSPKATAPLQAERRPVGKGSKNFDPNGLAAIQSFNESAANLPRQSSDAQTANLKNLQRGDNVRTVAGVPGEIASRAASGIANSAPVVAAKNVLTGQTPLVGSANTPTPRPEYQSTTPSGKPITTSVNPEKINPTRIPAPRVTNQSAEKKTKNPLQS